MNKRLMKVTLMVTLTTFVATDVVADMNKVSVKANDSAVKTMSAPMMLKKQYELKFKPKHRHAITQRLSLGGDGSTEDARCSGVSVCNDVIASCIDLGGDFTPTSYDPVTGSPNSGICFN